jgi:hypothetical protein
MKKLLIGIAVLLIFVSCSQEKKPKLENASYQMRSYGKMYSKYNQPYDVKISISYPEVKEASSPKVVTKINEAIMKYLLSPIGEDSVFASMDELFNNLTKSYDELQTDNPIGNMPWDLERDVEVMNNAKEIFSIKFAENSFLGGAHPNTVELFSNFDLKTGKELTLPDLFVNGYEDKLLTIAEKLFREQKKLSPEQNLDEADFTFENNKFALNNNFYISSEGIGFYYNPYEIAAYVYGPTELLIPFDKIKDIIKRTEILPAEHE